MTHAISLIPEWERADAVMLAWPHEHTDWAPWLEEARATYLQVIDAVNQAGAAVILLCQPQQTQDVQAQLPAGARVLLVPGQYNDTWMRDYGFLTCSSEAGNYPVEFGFNGWGGKFDAALDNQANQRYLAGLCRLPLQTCELIAEGGALEIDQHGHLLSTSQCLLNPKRNGDTSLSDYISAFKQVLGASQVTIFEHGHLEGDDTDGHVDTLVRFTPDAGLVIQACDNRPDDSHYAGLKALCDECAARLPEHHQFRLPLPHMVNADGERLPASYANFLICNDHVLAPVYQQPEDADAIRVLQQAYPKHTIVPVDCSVLVQQFGSLHCISMQVPQHTLTGQVLSQLQQGVSIYGI